MSQGWLNAMPYLKQKEKNSDNLEEESKMETKCKFRMSDMYAKKHH